MDTIKFTRHDELDHLLARIYLDTKRKLTKKELLEIIFEVGIQDYHYLIKKILHPETLEDDTLRQKFIEDFSGCLTLDDGDDDIDAKSIWVKHVED